MNEDSLILKLNALTTEIHQENNLVGQRTTWLVTSQAFLFGAFATLLNGIDTATKVGRALKVMRLMIPLVGLLLPSLVLLAVSAGTYVLCRLRKEHQGLCDTLAAKGIDWPRRQPRWVVLSGQLLPIAASVGFLIGWAVILIQIESQTS